MKEQYKQRLNENEGPQTIGDVFNIIRRGENAQKITDMKAARFKRAIAAAAAARVRAGGNPREIVPVMLGIPGDPITPADREWSSTFEREHRKPLIRSDATKASLKRIAAGVLAGSLLPGSIMGVAGLRAHRELGRNMEAQRQAEIGVQRAYGDLQDRALGPGRGMDNVNEGVVGRVMKKLQRTGELLKAVFTQDISPGQRLQINRNIRAKEQQGGTGMNLKEQYKQRLEQRMLEDLQTPERAKEMSKAVRGAKGAQKISRRLGFKTGVQVANAIVKAVSDRDKMEKRNPKRVYGKGGRVVGKVVPTKGSAARTR